VTGNRKRARGERTTAISALAVTAALVLVLAGCASRAPGVVRLSPSESQLSACKLGTSAIKVTDLGASDRASCDIAGQEVEFPDGTTLTAPVVGGSSGQQVSTGAKGVEGDQLTLTNLGVYGVVATSRTPSGRVSWWGTSTGIGMEKDADLGH
jgi:hypothetical protein